MKLRVLAALPALMLAAACGSPAAPPAATPAATETAPPAEPRPTYAATADAAVAAWAAFSPIPEVGPAEGVAAELGDCSIHLGKDLSVRICAVSGQLTNMVVTLRGQTTPARLNRALDIASSLIAPDAEPSDLTRIHREAGPALARGGSKLCPSTRCFSISAVGGAVLLSADALGN